MSVTIDRAKVTLTMPMDLKPVSNNGNVTSGLTTVFIIATSFKNTNLSFADMMLPNTLIGNEIARLKVEISIKISAIWYSWSVNPFEKIISK